ncbi:MAG: hypothetical protein IRZ08_08390 [Frankia sp.]|nr:hypothetical protein [Frankia sp.]
MKLYVICRSVGSENKKNRPEFYSKTTALASLLRAAENVTIPLSLVFANDGPIPDDRLELMRRAGEVLPLRCGSNRASLRFVLRLPRLRGWDPDDLVWFAEDDYLYTADALSSLVAAAEKVPEADYFAMYSTLRFAPGATRGRPAIDSVRTRAQGDDTAIQIGRVRWYRAVSTTSTFGSWVRTITADEWLLRSAPFVGGAFDHATCLAYQGYRPFSLAELPGEPLQDGEQASTAKRLARRVALTGARGALNVVALARPEQSRRVLIAPDPDLVTHMEAGLLSPGTDWAAEAEAADAWLRAARR